MEEIIGDASKARFIAVFIDNLISFALMLLLAVQVPEQYPLIKGILIYSSFPLYYILFEGIWSRTPGKYFQGLVVKKLDGSRCDWKSAIIRTILRVVEVNPLLLGGLPAGIAVMITERKQRIGDIIAGTLVVPITQKWTTEEGILEVESVS